MKPDEITFKEKVEFAVKYGHRINCGSCAFRKQGKTSCYCAHPLQPEPSLKKYVYHSDKCTFYEPGVGAGVPQ